MQKILVVEDDIDIQDILKNHLIDAGYEGCDCGRWRRGNCKI